MRSLKIIITVVAIIAMLTIPTGSDAETHPTELAELQFWNGTGADVILLYPDRAIGDTPLPALPGTASYWVRMDTGEVVTPETVFAPGTYLITAYSWIPEPWGSSAGSASTQKSGGLSAETIALIISGAILIGVPVALLGYYVYRRKHHL